MSKLKISPNLFLEVNELNKLVDFIDNSKYKSIIKQLVNRYGILKSDDNSFFKVSRNPNVENEIIINPGIAVDSDINFIHLRESAKRTLQNTIDKQWVTISYATTNDEIGSVSISNKGNMIGVGTKFLSVLRGQPNFPTKVKFTSKNNKDEYEVIRVISDTEAVISGSFIEENDIKYQVIGTFTPGFQPEEKDKTIYEYDSCSIGIIESEGMPVVDDNTYIIASIDFTNGINIQDQREERFNETLNHWFNVLNEDNPLVSLIESRIYNDNRILDLHIEWGYSIDEFKISEESNYTIFDVRGNSNYLTSSDVIPDNIFKGWKILNKKNMISVNIDYNENNLLYVSSYDPNIVTQENDEFVIIPNFNEIEISVKLSRNGYENKKIYFFKNSILNRENRICIPVEYGETLVELQYRTIDNNHKTTLFKDFPIANFNKVTNNGSSVELLRQSNFYIEINKVEEIENYS